MEVLKKVIFAVVLILISIGLIVVGNGSEMYKNALKEMPLSEKISNIEQKENYTKIEEVPKMYINAVISV